MGNMPTTGHTTPFGSKHDRKVWVMFNGKYVNIKYFLINANSKLALNYNKLKFKTFYPMYQENHTFLLEIRHPSWNFG